MTEAILIPGRESGSLEQLQTINMPGILIMKPGNIIGNKPETPPCNLPGILKFQGSRCGIAGVGETVLFRAGIVQCLKILLPHQHLSTNLNFAALTCRKRPVKLPEAQRNGGDGLQVNRNIVAPAPIPPRSPPY